MHVRPESDRDHNIVRRIHIVAFPTSAEAMLVDDLRVQAKPTLGLVAEEKGHLLGHIMFSPVQLRGHPELKALGLAPMAVAPEAQGKGVGKALVKAGLESCRGQGADVVVVLGDPAYYGRFGFESASQYGLSCDFEAPEGAFMVLELAEGALADRSGRIRYHQAFDSL